MKNVTGALVCLLIMGMINPTVADDGGKRKKKRDEVVEVSPPTATPEKKEDPLFEAIDEVTKKCRKMDGLFTMYQDTTTGKAYLEIRDDQIGQEFIYFKHVLDGVREARYTRGAYLDKRIFKIEKYFDRIEFREQNTKFYFDPESALAQASKANINEPVIMSAKISGMSSDTGENKMHRYLIEADPVFLAESINQVKPSSRPGSSSKSFNLGKLSKSKTKYKAIKNYPENTDVVVEYAFDNLYPSVSGGDAITNSRYVSMIVRHTFLKMPENNYKPRYEDSRVGYFTNKVTDMTSTAATPYRDVINRWHLEKKDPDAALSEPVEPIVWWIENTTPHEIRDIVKSSALKWNEAFEKAGFKNALVVKVQPDDAEWDAGDVRYNVLRWTSSPVPPFGGYGPRLANPRTGQIVSADIMLEFIALSNRLKMEKVFDRAGMIWEEDDIEMAWNDEGYCSAAMHAQNEQLFSNYAMTAMGLGDVEKSKMVTQSLARVVIHELGHTLGLMHNFCGSQMVSPEEINSPEVGNGDGISSTVMDYHATNLALDKEQQGHYYQDQPGVYDDWVIQYGYSQFPDKEAEQAGLEKILARSTEPALCFGNDADDMRSDGKGIDPRINIFDLTSDAVAFSIGRMELVKKTMPTLMDNLLEEGNSYHELRNGFLTLTGNYATALKIVGRHVGGVHIDRSRVGQETANKPLTPVPLAEQKRAMKTLEEYAFAPDAFEFSYDILNYLKMQRRGFELRGTTEDPKLHDRVLTMQKTVFNHLLHSTTLKRLTDSGLYGNEYSVAEMMGDLTVSIFDADLYKSVNTFRQNLQLEYVERLGKILKPTSTADDISRSSALYQLNKIQTKMTRARSTNESTKAHRNHVRYAIEEILDAD